MQEKVYFMDVSYGSVPQDRGSASSALRLCQIDSIISLRCRQRNPNPRAKRIMPEMSFTETPALSVDIRVGISGSTSEV